VVPSPFTPFILYVPPIHQGFISLIPSKPNVFLAAACLFFKTCSIIPYLLKSIVYLFLYQRDSKLFSAPECLANIGSEDSWKYPE
jgi:hypothetical protein